MLSLNGTGFVKATGTTISYDNTSYLPLGGGTLTGELAIRTNTTTGLNIISSTGTQALWVRAGYDTDGTATPIVSANNIQFQSSGSGAGSFSFVVGNDKALFIASNSAATFTGALIGTSATFSGILTVNSGASATTTSFVNNGDFISNWIGNSTTQLFSIRNVSTTGVYINTQNSAPLILGVSSGTSGGTVVNHLTIASTGAATFSSSGLFSGNLQANGTLTIGNQSVAGNYCLQVSPSTTTPISLQGILSGTGTAAIVLQPSGGSVGIGTNTPSANLSLSGSGDIGVRINASALSYIDFDNADSGTPNGSIAYNNSTNIMTFSTGGSNSERARITSSGSLLVATTTDLGSGYKLQVNGSISMAYANFFNFKGSSGAGDVLVDNSGSSLRVTGSVDISSSTLIQGLLTNYNSYNTQTSNYTLVLADASKIVEMNVGSANTVTVPANSSVAFPIGTEITVMQYGAGVTTIVAASGVTFRSKDFGTRIGDQYTGATLVKRGTNEWYLIGNIQP